MGGKIHRQIVCCPNVAAHQIFIVKEESLFPEHSLIKKKKLQEILSGAFSICCVNKMPSASASIDVTHNELL